jgi:NAD+ diphosphatase
MNFCRRCGESLTRTHDHVYECPNKHTLFLNPSPCVGIFFLTPENNLLLSVRGIEPHKDMLDAFGGFVDLADQSLEAAVQRELQEEVLLRPEAYNPLRYIISSYSTYPYQGEELPLMSTLFWTRLKPGYTMTAADDVAEVTEVSLHDVDLSLMHADDIRTGILELRKIFPKLEKEG